jgi:hypothetical protein
MDSSRWATPTMRPTPKRKAKTSLKVCLNDESCSRSGSTSTVAM